MNTLNYLEKKVNRTQERLSFARAKHVAAAENLLTKLKKVILPVKENNKIFLRCLVGGKNLWKCFDVSQREMKTLLTGSSVVYEGRHWWSH